MQVMQQVHWFLSLLALAATASVADPLNAYCMPAADERPANSAWFWSDNRTEGIAINTIAHPQPGSYLSQAPRLSQTGGYMTYGYERRGPGRRPASMNNSLPAGRRYYGGRYFGNFNNRFYGPQYGYF